MDFQDKIPRKRIISLDISILSYKEALDKIVSIAKSKKPGYVCFANVHMVIEAYKDKVFAAQVNNGLMILPDGVPLIKTLKSFYAIKQERIAGMDLMPDMIKVAERKQLKIFFFGTSSELLKTIKQKVLGLFPNSIIAGLLSPPFDKSLDDPSYIDSINASGADLVFVALGCPKQEKWMANNSPKINAILMGVGGAFPVFAGTVSRAPLFMRNAGLEWMYRVFLEPRRLFKRYLTTNTSFLFLVFVNKLKLIFTK